MKRTILICLLAAACHVAPQTTKSKAIEDTSNTIDSNDLISDFQDSTQTNKTLDTTRYLKSDTLRLIIRMERNGSFLLPEKYLEDAGLDSFRVWNMTSVVQFYVNGQLETEMSVTKANVAKCITDKQQKQYGVLMYPEVDSLNINGFQINYSFTIPLTDVSSSVTLKRKNNQVEIICESE